MYNLYIYEILTEKITLECTTHSRGLVESIRSDLSNMSRMEGSVLIICIGELITVDGACIKFFRCAK